MSLALVLLGAGPTVRADTQTKLRAWMDENIPQLLERYKVPGTVVGLVEDRNVAWAQGYGLADIEARLPMSNNTVFQAASISKSLTAWGVMKLAERDLIELDAPVDRYLERWHLPESPYNDEVTVRRVLSHTAGLSLAGYPGNNPDERLPTLVQSLSGRNSNGADVRAVEQPGERWRYSGGGYTLLQLLVEDVTGRPFEKYMEDVILRPLGMTHSSFVWEQRLGPATARAYSEAPKVLPNYLYPEKAAAGLYTTASDLARFVAALASPTAGGVLERDSLRTILTPAPATSGALGGYGFGVGTERLETGDHLVQHTGGNRGWAAIWMALPEKGAGLVMLTNSNTGSLLFVDTSCEWSRLTTGATPQACSAIAGFRSFVVGGTIASAVALVAYLAVLATGVSRKRRLFRRPRRIRWVRLPIFLLLSAVWVGFWHTTLATAAVGLGITPSLALPVAFRWASPVVAVGLLLLMASVFFPKADGRAPISRARRVIVASALSVAWILFLYTDVASRVVLRTAGPRPATLLSPGVELVTTALVLAVILTGSVFFRRRTPAS